MLHSGWGWGGGGVKAILTIKLLFEIWHYGPNDISSVDIY